MDLTACANAVTGPSIIVSAFIITVGIQSSRPSLMMLTVCDSAVTPQKHIPNHDPIFPANNEASFHRPARYICLNSPGHRQWAKNCLEAINLYKQSKPYELLLWQTSGLFWFTAYQHIGSFNAKIEYFSK